MEDFERWLIDEVETQTLTDELKDEILEKVKFALEDAYGEGYHDAKESILNHINNM
jgi:hypothetical protein